MGLSLGAANTQVIIVWTIFGGVVGVLAERLITEYLNETKITQNGA